MSTQPARRRTECDIAFYPARNEDELPMVRVGEVVVFAYRDEDGTVRVTVDTEEVDPGQDPRRCARVQVNGNSGTVWEG